MGESPRKRARSGDGEEPSLAFFELGEEEDDDALSDDEEVEEVVRIELTAQRTVELSSSVRYKCTVRTGASLQC